MASSSGTGREYPPELVHGELCATRFGANAECDCGKSEPAASSGTGHDAARYLTKERATEILAEAFPGANARRTMCGRCGEWSDYFPWGDLEDVPSGWERMVTGEHAWGSAPLCPTCLEAKRAR